MSSRLEGPPSVISGENVCAKRKKKRKTCKLLTFLHYALGDILLHGYQATIQNMLVVRESIYICQF